MPSMNQTNECILTCEALQNKSVHDKSTTEVVAPTQDENEKNLRRFFRGRKALEKLNM